MVNDLLLKYARQMRAKGIPDKKIQKALLAQGWKEGEILGALWFDSNKEKDKAPKKKRKHAPLISMLIILGIFWLAALLYLRIWDPIWNPMLPISQGLIDIFKF